MNGLAAILGLASLVSEVALASLRRASARGPEGPSLDGGSLRLLWRVIGGAMTAGAICSVFSIGPRLPAGWPWGLAGLAVFSAGSLLRWWAIWHLGRFFTVDVAVADGQRVVDDGPYRLVRHPSYTGLLLQFTGIGLAMGNGLGLAVIVVPILLALLHRIRIEETALRAGLGETYAAYARRTKKLVPLLF